VTVLADAAGWQPVLIQVGTLPMTPELLAPEGELEGMVDVPSNVLLLRGHGQTVLVDAGSGPHAHRWEAASEDLEGAMRAAGCRPEDVDLLVMTHLDFDHVGGCFAFLNARMAVPEGVEPSTDARDDPGLIALESYGSSGRLDRIADGGSPATGLVLRSAPGHRAGHSVVEVGDSLVHIADLVHHPLQVANPSWDHVFDSDPQAARATRLRELGRLADSGVTVVASHIAGPGTVERDGQGFRWVPI
jgi:glyoxylase-like metal-dependent hydrolase (beta-lactamase superfamily II)